MTNKNFLTFLEALQTLENLNGIEKKININLLASGEFKVVETFIKAEAAKNKIDLTIDFSPFGNLTTYLYKEELINDKLIILFPWDFIPALDWRTGIINPELDEEKLYLKEIKDFLLLLAKIKNAKIVYISALSPPLSRNNLIQEKILQKIVNEVSDLGALNLSSKFFNLDNYLLCGCPIDRRMYGEFSQIIIDHYISIKSESKKLLVTDLDSTLWNGILGEDGLDKINASSEGTGYIHFIYQTMLKRLKESGILISVASKNDKDLVLKAFSYKNFILKETDFVIISANYEAKSIQIKQIAKNLNIGLEHIVFVDDNLLEIEEVSKSLPQVKCIKNPKKTEKFITFIYELSKFFDIENITTEDKTRTSLYQKLELFETHHDEKGYNLFNYLKSLNMKLIINETKSNMTRAIQLINKTNQFNINGDRYEPQEIKLIISEGGNIITGELLDTNGNHGEIIVILINNKNEVLSFVMSCRVFERKVEFIFLNYCMQKYEKLDILYKETNRNKPIQNFLLEIYPNLDKNKFLLNDSKLQKLSNRYEDLFNIEYKTDE